MMMTFLMKKFFVVLEKEAGERLLAAAGALAVAMGAAAEAVVFGRGDPARCFAAGARHVYLVDGAEDEMSRALSLRKLVEREIGRLRSSFEAAKAAGYRKYIMFLHYPPTNILEEESGFTAIAEEFGAEQVIYAHCHGESRFHDSIQGEKNGILYNLVSGDYRKWVPLKLLD